MLKEIRKQLAEKEVCLIEMKKDMKGVKEEKALLLSQKNEQKNAIQGFKNRIIELKQTLDDVQSKEEEKKISKANDELLRKELDDNEILINQMKKQINKLENENVLVLGQKDEQSSTIKGLKKRVVELTEALETIRGKAKVLENEKERNKRRQNELNQNNEHKFLDVIKKIRQLEERENELVDENTRLKDRVTDKMRFSQEKGKENNDATIKLEFIRQSLKELLQPSTSQTDKYRHGRAIAEILEFSEDEQRAIKIFIEKTQPHFPVILSSIETIHHMALSCIEKTMF
jgi:chromosome segregation ATPase